LRVATFIVYSPGALQPYGHAFDYVGGLGSGLCDQGYQVHVVTHDGPLVLSDVMVHTATSAAWDRLLDVLPSRLRRHAFRLLAEPRLLSTLRRVTAEYPDAPVLFETFEYLSLARYLRRHNGGLTGGIFHSTTFRSEREGVLRTAYKRVSARAARRIARNLAVVYVHGPHMRRRLLDELSLPETSPVRVLAHGAPDPADVVLPSREKAREVLGLPAGNILLSFGTLRHDKDLPTLVRAVAATPDWVLVHAGPEGDVSCRELEQLGEANGLGDRLLIHKRFIPAVEHPLYFGAADLVSALYDPAMTHESGTAKRVRAFSRPLLAAGPPDLLDYVTEWGVGYTIPPGDVDAAAEALRRHAGLSPEDAAALEQRIYRAGQDLSWRAVAATIAADLCPHYTT
jgi:glycosyltransferase involved in cell wall biosynthesis